MTKKNIPALKTEIINYSEPKERLNAIFGLATWAYGDPDFGRDFVQELHKGHTGMALGAPDMETFVDVNDLVQTQEGTRRAVEYLQHRMVVGRLVELYKDAADAEAFMGREHMMIGMNPSDAIKNLDNGYELLMEVIDAAEAGVYI